MGQGVDVYETSEGETRGRQIAKTGEGVVGSSRRTDQEVYKRVTGSSSKSERRTVQLMNGRRWPNGILKQGGIANDAMRRDRPRLMLSPADYLTAINRASRCPRQVARLLRQD